MICGGQVFLCAKAAAVGDCQRPRRSAIQRALIALGHAGLVHVHAQMRHLLLIGIIDGCKYAGKRLVVVILEPGQTTLPSHNCNRFSPFYLQGQWGSVQNQCADLRHFSMKTDFDGRGQIRNSTYFVACQ